MRTVRHARARCTPQLRYAQTAQEGEGHGHRTGRGHRSDSLFCELRRLGTHLQSQAVAIGDCWGSWAAGSGLSFAVANIALPASSVICDRICREFPSG